MIIQEADPPTKYKPHSQVVDKKHPNGVINTNDQDFLQKNTSWKCTSLSRPF